MGARPLGCGSREGEAKASISFSAPAPRVGKRVKPSPREDMKFFFLRFDGIWLIYRLPQIPSGQPVAHVAES